MRKLRVGINGFGRIGRAIYRINSQKDYFEVVAINDINPDIKNIAYLLKYDTTYGRLSEEVNYDMQNLYVGESTHRVYHEKNIAHVPWSQHEVDIVIDASGIKANLDVIQKDNLNIQSFIVTNAPNEEIKTIIFGVNEDDVENNHFNIISSSICDTIACAPIIKLITDTHTIQSGFLITLHPWLSYQNLLDGPSVSWSQPGDIFSHYALGRASAQNIIPKSTSAILAANHVFPGLSDKIQSFSYRVPSHIVSSATIVLLLEEDIAHDDLLEKCYQYEAQQKYKVMHNSNEPLTSLDYCGEAYSTISFLKNWC